jgi:hypothetical protein
MRRSHSSPRTFRRSGPPSSARSSALDFLNRNRNCGSHWLTGRLVSNQIAASLSVPGPVHALDRAPPGSGSMDRPTGWVVCVRWWCRQPRQGPRNNFSFFYWLQFDVHNLGTLHLHPCIYMHTRPYTHKKKREIGRRRCLRCAGNVQCHRYVFPKISKKIPEKSAVTRICIFKIYFKI